MRARILSLAALTIALPAGARGQRALLLRDGHPTAVIRPGADLRALLEKVAAGPDAHEAALGLRTAVPRGVRLLALDWRGDRCEPTFDAGFAALVDRPAELELAIEQIAKTVFAHAADARAVDIHILGRDGRRRPLVELCREAGPPLVAPAGSARGPTAAAASTVQGALSGRTIVISPGHGSYWHASLGWTTQRPLIDGLLEDLHTNEIVIRWLIPRLEDLGARVVSVRERSEEPEDAVLDDDAGAPAFTTAGGWARSTFSGYGGGGYRYAATAPGAPDAATWRIPVTADRSHPVYVWYRAGSNRATDARYEVAHSGGTTLVEVDQTRDGMTWRHLGDFHFSRAEGATVRLLADAAVAGRVVIADAVRLGGGLGSTPRGGGTSGRPRWQEAARYWTAFAGAPGSVWDPVAGGEDNDDDVTARPRFAEWLGADAFVSLHTNAGGGSGTSSFIYNGGATAGSASLQARIHDQIVADVRGGYDPSWVDRGKLQANFGEVRLLSTMPGVLLELAFHDSAGSRDHRALHDPEFRRLAGRAIARGVLRHFAPQAPFAPDAPLAFHIVQDGTGGLRLGWLPVAGASSYLVERAPDGKGFVEVAEVPSPGWSSGPLPPGTLASFRVRARNGSGRSPATEVLCAGTSHRGTAELLLVQGFDRLERSVKARDNTFDYLARHGRAIRDAGGFSLGFDAASNEAVQLGLVTLGRYRAVDWASGEESTRHETFSTLEQQLVGAYLGQGGRLLVSGSEIGWDLEARGSAADLAFHRDRLGARYLADDAGTYDVGPAPGSIFDGLPAGRFDDGRSGTYDVDFPEVLAPAGPDARPALLYAGGRGTAALQRDDGTSRVVYLGFPLETLVDDRLRAGVMDRALRFLLAPRALEGPATVPPGGTATFTITEPAFGAAPYLLLAALATSPPTALPDGALLPLAADPLLVASLDPANGLFAGFAGRLDAGGRAQGTFRCPAIPQLRGLDLFVSGVVLGSANPWSTATVLPYVRLGIR
jgi:N-acetylmuramoyl-L-alanine amidase